MSGTAPREHQGFQMMQIAFIPMQHSDLGRFNHLVTEYLSVNDLAHDFGWGRTGDAFGSWEIRPGRGILTVPLRLIPLISDGSETLLCCLLHDDATEVAGEVEIWTSAVIAAAKGLLEPFPEHNWTAVIGPDPDSNSWGSRPCWQNGTLGG